MSILKTTDELKKHFSSVDKDYKIASLASFISDAEQTILVPALGVAYFTQIDTAYNAGNAEGNMAIMIILLQKAVAHLALMLSADSGSFRVSDAGYYISISQNQKPVSDKKMSEFKKGRREAGYQALEMALVFAESSLTDPAFAVWKSSQARKQRFCYFFQGSVDFTFFYRKLDNSAYLFNQILDSIDLAERKYLAPVLGKSYYRALKAKVPDYNFTDSEQDLLREIKRALAPLAMALALPGLQADIDASGIFINSMPAFGNTENVEGKAAASEQQLQGIAGNCMAIGQQELRSLQAYLLENAADLPGYLVPVQTGDVNINDPKSKTYFV